MKLLLLYRHHRRCIAGLWRDAFRELEDLDIRTCGPWYEGEPFGTPGNEPDVALAVQSHLYWYEWRDVEALLPGDWRPDLTIILGQGEKFRVFNIAGPWVHLDTEGADTAWSTGITPSRYTAIRRTGHDAALRFIATGLPPACARRELPPLRPREYDFVHIATPRAARQAVWKALGAVRDLNTIMGELWGGLYYDALGRAATTYVCAGGGADFDFITLRTLEAMAMGCLVFSDITPALVQLFEPNEHFIPYTPIHNASDGEPTPDPDWLLTAVREWTDAPLRLAIGRRAAEVVRREHTMHARAERVLREAATDWSIGLWPQ